jgi:hypothetical protein
MLSPWFRNKEAGKVSIRRCGCGSVIFISHSSLDKALTILLILWKTINIKIIYHKDNLSQLFYFPFQFFWCPLVFIFPHTTVFNSLSCELTTPSFFSGSFHSKMHNDQMEYLPYFYLILCAWIFNRFRRRKSRTWELLRHYSFFWRWAL